MSLTRDEYREELLDRLRQFDRPVAVEHPDTAFELNS